MFLQRMINSPSNNNYQSKIKYNIKNIATNNSSRSSSKHWKCTAYNNNNGNTIWPRQFSKPVSVFKVVGDIRSMKLTMWNMLSMINVEFHNGGMNLRDCEWKFIWLCDDGDEWHKLHTMNISMGWNKIHVF